MPAEFTVEDGSGMVNANSYVSVEFADQYHLDRGRAQWAAFSTGVKQNYLIRATDYVDNVNGSRWIGLRGSEAQSLDWPRSCVVGVEPDALPVKLLQAVCEYGLRCHTGELAPDPLIGPSGVVMVTTSMKAGPVEQKFQSSAGSSAPASIHLLKPYPQADMLLSRLIIAGGNRVIR